MNKALDYNKLKESHKKGKLLKKNLKFPMYGSIKYDGNYTVVKVREGTATYITSGGHTYTNNHRTLFDSVMMPQGVYLCERIYEQGKLGDRKYCSLRGKRGEQIAYNHDYKVHDYLTLQGYEEGKSLSPYSRRRENLSKNLEKFRSQSLLVDEVIINNEEELEVYLKDITDRGYEGIILKSPNWLWNRTTSRKPEFTKYKKRPTADLLCTGVVTGVGKYLNSIGSLELIDSKGRRVRVGSGMSDEDRDRDPNYFIGRVVEVFYEQVIHTYIQPTFGSEYEGVLIREDKTKEDID